MKNFSERSMTNERQNERPDGNSFEDLYSNEEVNKKPESSTHHIYSNNPFIIRRYTFDDNGGGYQGL